MGKIARRQTDWGSNRTHKRCEVRSHRQEPSPTGKKMSAESKGEFSGLQLGKLIERPQEPKVDAPELGIRDFASQASGLSCAGIQN
jgi:hypothetical protein